MPSNRRSSSEQFVLQGFDTVTEAAVLEARVYIIDLGQVRAVIGKDADNDPDLARSYNLSRGNTIAIGELCEPPFVPDDLLTAITPWHPIREIPYLVQTNLELPLMLEKRKPMAMFSDSPE